MLLPPENQPPSSQSGPAPATRRRVRLAVLNLLYQDFWSSPPGPELTSTFQELGLTALDLHLLQFELQMIFGINITGEFGGGANQLRSRPTRAG